MVFEAEFLSYGGVGLLAGTLFYLLIRQMKKDDERDSNMSQLVNNNTIAMTRIYEIVTLCKYNLKR